MLKKTRTVIAAIFLLLITLLFLDFTGTLHAWFGWMAKIQFLPAILALNLVIVSVLVLLTLLFGRIYCSVICPLGVFQDFVSWIRGHIRKKDRMRFSCKPAHKVLRYGVLVIFILSLLAGSGVIASILAPYGAYGRIVSNIFSPIWRLGNNFMAYCAERFDSYTFYSTDVWVGSITTLTIAVLSLAIIIFLSWKDGRIYCNSICPVGSVLGFLSKFSLFKIKIDADKCTGCSLCSKGCKASCIDFKSHKVDYSRCVSCFNCIDNCHSNAISYSVSFRSNNDSKKGNDAKICSGNDIINNVSNDTTIDENKDAINSSRRTFLSTSALLLAGSAIKAQEHIGDGGLAVIEDKKIPNRSCPVVPAGAVSLASFTKSCVACQLCVSVCENRVLHPSSDLSRLMIPEMSFEKGFCRPECTKCGEVCPAGAISPVTKEDKSSIQVGHAVWIADNCLAYRGEAECGNCARHCPSGAIRMVKTSTGDENSFRIPTINTERCIGCGACEYLCPARPLSAIYVEGNEVHRTI